MSVRFVFLALAIFILASASTLAVACADFANYNTLVCGSTPDSALGLGAVDICEECYPCGVADGVCPEDFYNGDAGRGSCRFCPDPDCMVTIDGSVQDAEGTPVFNASIIVLYEPDVKDIIAYTDFSGNYVGQIRTGFNSLFVSYQDYDSRIIKKDIQRLNVNPAATIDFIGDSAIEPGSCSSSCTDNYGDRCKASCDGVNGCQFNNHSVSTLCDDKVAGSRVFLTDDSYIVCCEEAVVVQGSLVYSTTTERIQAEISFRDSFAGGVRGFADNLVTFTQRTRSHGERVNLQVAVWGSQNDE